MTTISEDSNEPRSAAINIPSGETVGLEKPPLVVSTVDRSTEMLTDPDPASMMLQSYRRRLPLASTATNQRFEVFLPSLIASWLNPTASCSI
jgi:hypothetical protein